MLYVHTVRAHEHTPQVAATLCLLPAGLGQARVRRGAGG